MNKLAKELVRIAEELDSSFWKYSYRDIRTMVDIDLIEKAFKNQLDESYGMFENLKTKVNWNIHKNDFAYGAFFISYECAVSFKWDTKSYGKNNDVTLLINIPTTNYFEDEDGKHLAFGEAQAFYTIETSEVSENLEILYGNCKLTGNLTTDKKLLSDFLEEAINTDIGGTLYKSTRED